MSRGGRGGFRGGRGGAGGGNALPPMGLTHADIQALSREATAMYPPMRVPVLAEVTDEERKICAYQRGFGDRIRSSKYYIVESNKTKELEQYSDRQKMDEDSRPKLKRKDLHATFFPIDILEDYFNPKRKKQAKAKKKAAVGSMDIKDDEDKSEDEASIIESDAGGSDYDVDEEYDNDYAENYFDNGEGDEDDGLGGGGDDGGGGGGAPKCTHILSSTNSPQITINAPLSILTVRNVLLPSISCRLRLTRNATPRDTIRSAIPPKLPTPIRQRAIAVHSKRSRSQWPLL
ncbi:hypothetical protein CYLTODRAFT_474662 [Cylindrobasidium torrendii FP15055 ss-10]|uniref:DNA-directed RNA polymerase III subunit n=1 Tax=Cylindrobasidium torrendii FP15055 ss-10 TaxID=1314674 RepID=A0A0D7AVJ4_9AGAR|nr:hypothetical protein CYLTODRAFT_474662 [Cylindrobasidium torrendii FP15055 ss-10]